MSSVMVLGPDTATGPDDSALHVQPTQGKKIVANVLETLECPAFTLEGKPDHDGETKIRKFMRLVRTEQVARFILFWPQGTTLQELDVEVGHLLTRIVEGATRPEDVIIVAEQGNEPLQHDEGEPVLAFDDGGDRTRHYTDLVDEGCQVRRWFDLDSLGYVVAGIAIEHKHRGGGKKMADLVKMVDPRLPKGDAADGAQAT